MANIWPKFFDDEHRIISVDVLRGIAIMGILLVNGPTLNGPAIKDTVDFAFQNGFYDAWYTKLIFIFAVGKFYPIFACLFGISAAIFMNNKGDKASYQLWLRRMLALLLIGFCHALFIWWGDILVVYSLLGILMIFMYKKTVQQIVRVLFIILAVSVVLSVYAQLIPSVDKLLVESSDSIYQTAGFLEITKQRALDFYGVYVPGVFYQFDAYQLIEFSIYYLQLLMLFILGFYFYQSGYCSAVIKSEKTAAKLVRLMLAVSLLLFVLGYSSPFLKEFLDTWLGIILGLFYMTLIFWLFHHRKCAAILKPFAHVGRMSLTNYLLHTSLLSLLFYGYGFGLYGKVGPFFQAPILFSMMMFSVIFSSVWLKHFHFGPMEWLWRAVTYGKISKLRKGIKTYAISLEK